MSIDWMGLTDGYNLRKNTRLAEKELLEMAYARSGSLRAAGDYLGICHITLTDRMKKLGIKINSSGGIRTKTIFDETGLLVDGANPKIIAEALGCTAGWVYRYAKRCGIAVSSKTNIF